jgi:hypothetical protein
MPEPHTFVLFAAASLAFIAVPGPAGSVRGWLGERRKALARISGCSYVGLGVLAALSPGSSSSADELMQ